MKQQSRRYKGINLRYIYDQDEEIWFVLSDVCAILRTGRAGDLRRQKRTDQSNYRMMDVITDAGIKAMIAINATEMHNIINKLAPKETQGFKSFLHKNGLLIPEPVTNIAASMSELTAIKEELNTVKAELNDCKERYNEIITWYKSSPLYVDALPIHDHISPYVELS